MDKKKQHLLAGVFVPVMLLAAVPAVGAPATLLLAQAEEPPPLPPGEAPPADPSEQMERQPEAEAAPPPEAPAPEPEAPAPEPEPEPEAPEPEPEPEAPAPEPEAPAPEAAPAPEPEAPPAAEQAPPPEPEAAEPPAAEAPPEDPEGQQRRSREPDAPAPEAPAASEPAPEADAPAETPEAPAEAAPSPEPSAPAESEAPRAADEPAAEPDRAADEDRTPESARERRDTVREELRRRQQEGDEADRADDTAPAPDAPAAAAAPDEGGEPEAEAVTEGRRDRLRALEERRERREEALDRDLDEAERDARRAERLRDREERLADREERLRLFEERQDERLSDIRRERREIRDEEGRVVIVEPGGRRIIRDDGRTIIRYNEIDRLGFGADDVITEDRDGRTFTTIVRPGGVRVITVTDDDGRVLRRIRRTRDGDEYVLFDNTRSVERGRERDDYYVVDVPPPVWDLPEDEYIVEADEASPEAIYEAFAAAPVDRLQQRYSLDQVVNTPALRERVRRVDLDTITFDTGSSRVNEDQIGALETISNAILSVLEKNPNEVFLIEGHTDAVGSDLDNLSLSDRRAEEVAALLTEYYDVPAENLTTKGYGEQYLKVNTEGDERENRRVTMRRITDLLETSQAR